MSSQPALLGGEPLFATPLPFAQPTIEEPERVESMVGGALSSGRLTDGPLVRELEERIAETFRVAHCVAVSSCTVGLMLVIQALRPAGPVLIPSFTFSATAHAACWNGVEIVFADCDPETWCLGSANVAGRPALVVGVHVSGVPCDVDGLSRMASESGAALIFDAAHGAGSLVTSNGSLRPLGGFGLAEVFSLTPTKVLGGAEGGLIATNDAALADELRVARNYGNPGDYNTRVAALNGRLSELHAALALAGLDHLEARVAHRNRVAGLYRDLLSDLPGIGFQAVPAGERSSYKDFSILIDAETFGCCREAAAAALQAEGVEVRRYYSPPVHMQAAYSHISTPPLPVTERLAEQVISLPIWSHMPLEVVERTAGALARIHRHAAEVDEIWSERRP
ncbi:MAG: DegT/DnrJ/EryC1/StrS family aminotransferase [Acidimicrobiia bacterium]